MFHLLSEFLMLYLLYLFTKMSKWFWFSFFWVLLLLCVFLLILLFVLLLVTPVAIKQRQEMNAWIGFFGTREIFSLWRSVNRSRVYAGNWKENNSFTFSLKKRLPLLLLVQSDPESPSRLNLLPILQRKRRNTDCLHRLWLTLIHKQQKKSFRQFKLRSAAAQRNDFSFSNISVILTDSE